MDDVREQIARIPWFAALDEAVRAELIRRGRLEQRSGGEWLYGEGDEKTGLVAVLEGGLYLHSEAPGGQEVLVSRLSKGGVLGQSIAFGGGPRLLTAICAVDSRLFLLSDRALREAAGAHPTLWMSLSALLYEQLGEAVRTVAEFVALKPRQRMISRLLSMAAFDNTVAIPQSVLAEIVGVRRNAVHAWLAELEEAGEIRRDYGRIRVLDPKALQRRLHRDA